MVIVIFVIVCLLGGMFPAASPATYLEDFDSDPGWLAPRLGDTGDPVYPFATWTATGGNPDGNLAASVTTAAPRLYGFQPTILAPYGALTGLTLTVDFRLEGTVTGPATPLVRFFVGTYTGGYNYFVTTDAFSWHPPANTGWTTHRVALDPVNFLAWPNQNTGSKTFAQVIAAPEDIGLVFAGAVADFGDQTTLGFSGTGTISLDNFGAVPLPGALALLGAGFIRLVAYARKQSRQSGRN